MDIAKKIRILLGHLLNDYDSAVFYMFWVNFFSHRLIIETFIVLSIGIVFEIALSCAARFYDCHRDTESQRNLHYSFSFFINDQVLYHTCPNCYSYLCSILLFNMRFKKL